MPSSFQGTSRFRIRRALGSGGFGAVYEAWDVELGVPCALKMLTAMEPWAFRQFKSEFRRLADLAHPNLVSLYELHEHEGQWFLTMELVRGVGLSQWLASSGGSSADRTLSTLSDLPQAEEQGVVSEERDWKRVRSTFRQIRAAVSAMHSAGVIHRDLKPSNIMVEADGRVVVLDFGLVLEKEDSVSWMAGTPAYLAPELLVAHAEATPAGDWYAVGCMLFEALTGARAFPGNSSQVMAAKRAAISPDPRELRDDLPPDLVDLCVGLLCLDPEKRAGEAEVRAVTGGEAPPSATVAFVGRSRERAALAEALEHSRTGLAIVTLDGPSGIGKSALVQEFLARDVGEARVLRGRCFSRESVPYQAIDELAHALADLLAERPHVAEKVGRHVGSATLSALLPQLGGVLGPGELQPLDGHELRGLAARALGEALTELASEEPLILWLDDVQWADEDGAAVLLDALSPPGAPQVLVVATQRDGSSRLSSGLARLGVSDAVHPISLTLDELDASEARQLAAGLEGRGQAEVLEAAQGHPYLLQGLIRHTGWRAADSLQELIIDGVASLSERSRQLLTQVCLCNVPISRGLHCEAAAWAPGADQLEISTLRWEQLIVAHGRGGGETLAPYHDVVRRAVVSTVKPEARGAIHRSLLHALQARTEDNLEALLHHAEGCGERELAASLATRAAEVATEALAFRRAAALLERARRLGADGLEERLGDALADAGRCIEAGQVFLEAAELARGNHQVDLRRRAAVQLYVGGRDVQAEQVVTSVLRSVGESMPGSGVAALPALAMGKARLWWRGTGWTRNEDADPAALLAADACWVVASTMSTIDEIRAAGLQARHTLLALDAGEPFRVLRSLALGDAYDASLSSDTTPPDFTEHEALAATINDPRAVPFVTLCKGMAAYVQGRWADAMPLLQAADREFARCRDVGWERGILSSLLAFVANETGEWGQIRQEVPERLKRAHTTGNLHDLSVTEFTRATTILLADDRPDVALRGLLDVPPPAERFTIANWRSAFGQAEVHLYAGDPDAAMATLDTVWPRLRKSLLLWIPLVKMHSHEARARVRLAQANRASGTSRSELVRRARKDVAALRGVVSLLSDPIRASLEGCCACLDGQDASAHWEETERLLRRAGMGKRLAALHSHLGHSDAASELDALGVRAPDRFVAWLLPGAASAPPADLG